MSPSRRARSSATSTPALEPVSWKELRDACGFIHDVVVDETNRRAGTATALMDAAMQWLT